MKKTTYSKKAWIIGIICFIAFAVGFYFIFQHHIVTVAKIDDSYQLFYKGKTYQKGDRVLGVVGDATYVGEIAYQAGDSVQVDKAHFLLEGQNTVPKGDVMLRISQKGKEYYVRIPIQDIMGKAVFSH